MADPVLAVRGLTVTFPGSAGDVRAVRGIDYELQRGEVLGIVGESGSGKSASATAVTGLLPASAVVDGSIRLDGEELIGLDDARMAKVRGKRIAMVFQDPLSALTPVYTVGDQLSEAVRIHNDVSRQAARERSVELLKLVGIPHASERADAFPHEFSGGMRQRIMIALALVLRPAVVVADEPTTALDVLVEAQILRIIADLRRNFDTALLLITHNLGIVAEACDRVAVMYAGQIVEEGDARDVFSEPAHPYTRELLRSTISLDTTELHSIPGAPPNLITPPTGCRFHPRCLDAMSVCATPAAPTRRSCELVPWNSSSSRNSSGGRPLAIRASRLTREISA